MGEFRAKALDFAEIEARRATLSGDMFAAYLAAELQRYYDRSHYGPQEFAEWMPESRDAVRGIAGGLWRMIEAAKKQCLGGALGRLVTEVATRVTERLTAHVDATREVRDAMTALHRAAGETEVLEAVRRSGSLRCMALEPRALP